MMKYDSRPAISAPLINHNRKPIRCQHWLRLNSKLLTFIGQIVILGWGWVGTTSVAAQTTAEPASPTMVSDFAETPGLDTAQIDNGWLSLFDGESFFGWQPVTNADWSIENKEIHVSSGKPGLLRTTTQFDDFVFELDFKCGEKTNSGIFLRTSPEPQNVTRDCYELNIAPRSIHEFPTGSLVGRIATQQDFKTTEWTHLKAIVDGPKISVWIDNKPAVEYVDPKPLGRGYIGLQLNSGEIAFKNICLKPLNVPEMLLDADLTGWNTRQKLDSQFSMTERNELSIKNGRGQLESDAEFADFVFSLKCKTKSAGLNSGVFFRSIAGEFSNGYESQIQNQFVDGDRTNPVDCGTGGIFRRVNARRVNANDQQWFNKTIMATGAHIGVWVNGYQVTDWSDTRPPHSNPRNGKRLAAGTIIIQGHDPTTDILMKEIRVRELAGRGK